MIGASKSVVTALKALALSLPLKCSGVSRAPVLGAAIWLSTTADMKNVIDRVRRVNSIIIFYQWLIVLIPLAGINPFASF